MNDKFLLCQDADVPSTKTSAEGAPGSGVWNLGLGVHVARVRQFEFRFTCPVMIEYQCGKCRISIATRRVPQVPVFGTWVLG
jgi:hypothetical protein